MSTSEGVKSGFRSTRSGLRRKYVGHGLTSYPPGRYFDGVTDLYTGKLFMVIDISYSMEGNRLAQAKEGALELLRQAVGEGYRAGVISFAQTARLDLPLTTDLEEVARVLRSLGLGGGTDMSRGIHMAHENLREMRGERAMAIFSDGETDRQSALAAARAARADGIRIIASLGGTADKAFMEQIVSEGETVEVVDDSHVREQIAGLAASLRPTWGS